MSFATESFQRNFCYACAAVEGIKTIYVCRPQWHMGDYTKISGEVQTVAKASQVLLPVYNMHWSTLQANWQVIVRKLCRSGVIDV